DPATGAEPGASPARNGHGPVPAREAGPAAPARRGPDRRPAAADAGNLSGLFDRAGRGREEGLVAAPARVLRPAPHLAARRAGGAPWSGECQAGVRRIVGAPTEPEYRARGAGCCVTDLLRFVYPIPRSSDK